MNTGYSAAIPVAELGVDARAAFVGRTYSHLFGAIMGFTAVEFALFQLGLAERLLQLMGGMWLIALGAFVIVGFIFRGIAHGAKTLPGQYLGLAGYVVAEAVFFCPLLYVASNAAWVGSATVIRDAAIATLVGFTALTAIAFISRKDFTFLGSILKWGGICALMLIIFSALGGFSLGIVFAVGMVALAGGAILYDTSNVLHHYPEDKYVAASLELFASVALMFWYMVQIFMHLADE